MNFDLETFSCSLFFSSQVVTLEISIFTVFRSSGYDSLNSELLKLISNDISNAITMIVNQSLKSCIFPTKLKIAKGCKKLQTNYYTNISAAYNFKKY